MWRPPLRHVRVPGGSLPEVARRAFLRGRRRVQANKQVQFGYGLNYLIDIIRSTSKMR
jgi:hypothetical protein